MIVYIKNALVSSTATVAFLVRQKRSLSSTNNSTGGIPLCVMTARSPQQSMGGFIEIPNNNSEGTNNSNETTAKLPYLRQSKAPLNILVGHGLGTNPPEKTHLNDISHDLWRDCNRILQDRLRTEETIRKTDKLGDGSAVLYTARGHGFSYGWDSGVSKEGTDIDLKLAQAFTWSALAQDMKVVVDKTLGADSPHTIFGQSMGAATAIYHAMNYSNNSSRDNNQRVQALILARLPRIWEERQRIAHNFIQSAKDYQSNHKDCNHHLPILAASFTDLPAKDDKRWKALSNIPIFILCHGEDENHPVESGLLLQQNVLPHATLHTSAKNEDQARLIWPQLMADWLIKECLV